MDLEPFNRWCSRKPGTHKVIQWGGAHVWKVGDKIFAIASHWGKTRSPDRFKIAFKASEFSFRILTEQPNIIPAPYLGRYHWVQVETPDALSDAELTAYLEQAYTLVFNKLTRAQKKAIEQSPR